MAHQTRRGAPGGRGQAGRGAHPGRGATDHPSEQRRHLSRRHGRLIIDQQKVKADTHLDGKFLLSSDDDLVANEIALSHKQLAEVEQCWRDQKHILDLRPVYHRKEQRIRAHVLLSFLVLLLTRVAETRTNDTWRNLRRELERIRLGHFQGSAGRAHQRTELSQRQREILTALDAPEPPRFLALEPTITPYSHAARTPNQRSPRKNAVLADVCPLSCRTPASRAAANGAPGRRTGEGP